MSQGVPQLIGRDEVLESILTPPAGAPAVASIHGELGSGRTTVLRRLQSESKQPVRVFDCEQYDPGYGGQYGANVSVGAAQASYARWVELLTDIAHTILSEEAADAIETTGRRARTTIGPASALRTSMQELEVPFETKDQAEAVAQAATLVSETFRARWADRPHNAGPLLLDNIDVVMDQELGRWLVDLLGALNQEERVRSRTADVVVARTLEHDDRDSGTDADSQLEFGETGRRPFAAYVLTRLSESQVGDFIRAFRNGDPADSTETIHRLHDITSGHPATLRLVCEVLYGTDAPSDDTVPDLVRQLPSRGRQQAALLVEGVLTQSGRHDLLRAIQVSATTRKFDLELLRDLLVADGYIGDVIRLFDVLPQHSFVERLDEDGTVLRVNDYVRRSLVVRLQSSERKRFERLSGAAAAHYRELLLENHRDRQGNIRKYGSSYLYESPTWQVDVREWLYHSGGLTDLDSQADFLQHAAMLFLDAFFWWGNYVHFDFCDQLVADLGQLVRRRARPRGSSGSASGTLDVPEWKDLERLHAALIEILDNYPPRSIKTSGADWERVASALTTVQRVCGLTGRGELSNIQAHVAGLVQVFTAHAWRFRSPGQKNAPPSFRLAEKAYEAANRYFATSDEDDWARAWVYFEWAEMTLAAVQRPSSPAVAPLPHAASEKIQTLFDSATKIVQPASGAASALDDEPDHELMSNLHRLRGDLQSRTGDIPAAAESYGRAVFHAFLFHLVGGPPDEYTMQFYVDVRARVLRFLLSIWLEPDSRTDALIAARTAWPPAYAHHRGGALPEEDDRLESLFETAVSGQSDSDSLAEALWPKGPEVSELGSYKGACAKAVDALSQELQYDSDYLTDLHTPATRGPQATG